VFVKIIFSNKLDLFWTASDLLYKAHSGGYTFCNLKLKITNTFNLLDASAGFEPSTSGSLDDCYTSCDTATGQLIIYSGTLCVSLSAAKVLQIKISTLASLIILVANDPSKLMVKADILESLMS